MIGLVLILACLLGYPASIVASNWEELTEGE